MQNYTETKFQPWFESLFYQAFFNAFNGYVLNSYSTTNERLHVALVMIGQRSHFVQQHFLAKLDPVLETLQLVTTRHAFLTFLEWKGPSFWKMYNILYP